jgi:phosphoribosylformimino-5-aminoimidazole carboxamide ribotide isomerase
VDVEGLGQGLDPCLVRLLAESSPLPTTYAGGISTAADLDCLESVGGGRLDFTVGTALDIFGGTGLEYRFLVERFSRES